MPFSSTGTLSISQTVPNISSVVGRSPALPCPLNKLIEINQIFL
jgi:hypothetical protein